MVCAGCAGLGRDLAALGACTALESLLLNHYRLPAFPAALWQLPRLRVLGLCNNALQEIPATVSQLSSLDSLDVRNNDLRALPYQLALLPLRSLLVRG